MWYENGPVLDFTIKNFSYKYQDREDYMCPVNIASDSDTTVCIYVTFCMLAT